MYNRYCEIRDSKGFKDADVSRITGITKSTFSDWKNGRYKPKDEKLLKIAECLGVSYEYLTTGKEPSMPSFEPDHLELVRLYSKLNEEQKKTVMTFLRSLALQD